MRLTTQTKGITARDLLARSTTHALRQHVREQVDIIDAIILNAHECGRNSIRHELPSTFSIMGISKQDAQTMVYSEVLMIYKCDIADGGKGFTNTTIDLAARSYICIAWTNGMCAEEKQQRAQFIKSCLTNN